MERTPVLLGMAVLVLASSGAHGCTTARRAGKLVVDHHVGMARGAVEVLTGEAEERERKIAGLQAELASSRERLQGEQDPEQLVESLRRHVLLQDELLGLLLRSHHEHHGHGAGGGTDHGTGQ